MNFASTLPYVDVCVEYAYAYTQSTLSGEFSRTVNRICRRHSDSEDAIGKPLYIRHGPFETEALPTSIHDGLWHFFGNRQTRNWSRLTFAAYFAQVKAEMVDCYIPFRSFSEENFQDAMRLRVYQDAMNIMAGRSLDGVSSKTYSTLQKVKWRLKRISPPEL